MEVRFERKGHFRIWWSVERIGKEVDRSRDNRKQSIRDKEMEIRREKNYSESNSGGYTVTASIMLLKLWY